MRSSWITAWSSATWLMRTLPHMRRRSRRLLLVRVHHQDRAADAVPAVERHELDPRRHAAAPPIDGVQLELGLAVAAEHLPYRRVELLDRQADVEVHEVPAEHLLGPQAPELERRVVPARHLEVLVDDHDGGAQAAEDALEERVHFVQLVGALL